MNKESLFKAFEEYEISCDQSQLDLLFALMKSTLEANEKFNLTAITDEEVFAEKMIFDCALMLHDFDLENGSYIDIGTGAGFPGMVVRILSKDAKVTLLDSTKKKIDYLNDFAKEHNLKVTCVSERAEDFARNNREKYDFASARAVSALPILLEITIPLLKVGGTFIALKGADYEAEINTSQNAFKKLGCHIEHIYEVTLPKSQEKRAIIYIKKDKETNKKYPRQYNEIKRQTL